MTILLAIARGLGLPLCIFLGMLAFYEGMPGASRIPYLTSVPIIGDLTAGRVTVERDKAAKAARQACVSETLIKAQQAEAAERARQQRAGAVVLEEYRRKLEAERTAQAQAQDKLEQEIADHEREIKALGRSCAVIDDADRDWLLRH